VAPPLSHQQEALVARIRNRPTAADIHLARFSNAADSLLQAGDTIVLTVAPDQSAIVVGESVSRRAPWDVSWAGPIQGESGWVTLVLTIEGITGTLQGVRKDSTGHLAHASYKFEPLGGGLEALVCVDESKYSPD